MAIAERQLVNPMPEIIDLTDYGTPAVESEQQVQLQVDGRAVSVPAGTSIMRAAVEAGVHIPKLCATDSLAAFGSCRLCMVEIEGVKGAKASCHTPVSAGMEVRTQSPQLARWRKQIMELYISDHPLDCLTCAANGDCELQDMAGVVGLRSVRFPQGKTHLGATKDESNPYFTFDPSKCIVCSRCVRACEEVQGTFALTIDGRGFASHVSAGGVDFMDSECVSCGACVQACPTATLMENSVIEHGLGEHKVLTTCAYCGVGCNFVAEVQGEQVVRMTPYKHGKANSGHSCVKGRFAWQYARHDERLRQPLIRDSIDDEWREVSWEQAVDFAAQRIASIQQEYGRNSVGAITSSRCTNEETYLVQKMVRAAFGNNNVDTCARVCHSPTGYGLKKTFGTSAGTQHFASAEHADLFLIIGANPTDAHPVFASRMKKRLRAGAKLIIVDPRSIDLVRSTHVEADHHLALQPGTNVAMVNALAHTIVDEGLEDKQFIAERCDPECYEAWLEFIMQEKNSPEAVARACGVAAEQIRAAARAYAAAPNAAIYYGLGVTEHSQGSSMVMGIANLAMLTGNIGREGVGVNPLRGQNNVQGACDMGSFPHEFPGYRHVSDAAARKVFEQEWGVELVSEPGLRIPNMLDAAISGRFKGIFIQGEDLAQSDPNTAHVVEALSAMDCVIVQDIFYNESCKYAHVVFPGASFLEKDGTFTNAERRINRVRQAMQPLAGKAEWQTICELSAALGYSMSYDHPEQIMAEIARTTPSFAGVSYDRLDELGSVQWPCNEQQPEGSPVMHVGEFVIGMGKFMLTEYVPTSERSTRRYPLILTTGRILSQYNVGTQTRRTENKRWMSEDILEIHPADAETRGISDGQLVEINSRSGATQLHAQLSDRIQPGVVYTTFHFPQMQTNIITTDNSDWATNCPEYKVTAVEVRAVSEVSRVG